MHIYTSNFATLPSIPSAIVPIAICLKTPSDYDGLRIMELAPTPEILYGYKADSDEELYIRCFHEEILGPLDAAEMYKKIESLSEGKDCVLLCYEEIGAFCHRHLVAEWLEKSIGIVVQEYMIK